MSRHDDDYRRLQWALHSEPPPSRAVPVLLVLAMTAAVIWWQTDHVLAAIVSVACALVAWLAAS